MDGKKFPADKENEVENIPAGKENPSAVKKLPAENEAKKLPAGNGDPLTAPDSTPKKSNWFELKKSDVFARWNFDTVLDTCRICRNDIMDYCLDYSVKAVLEQSDSVSERLECDVAWGVCNHAFHLHCINAWLKRRPVCPLDNSKWEFQKYGRYKE